MANATKDDYLLNEAVTFIQHHLPGLDPGAYDMTVAQTVFDGTSKQVDDNSLKNTYRFAVKGDRFALSNPAQTLAAVFPAEGQAGEFSTVLPHALFYKKTLPWIRFPNLNPPFSSLQPGKDVDGKVPTWLAVLLFDEDDTVEFPALELQPQNRFIGDLFPPAAHPGSTLGGNLSYFQGATGTSGLEYGEQTGDAIQTIDLPLQLFWRVVPTLDDLYFLAHARQVSLTNKPTDPNAAPLGESTGDFSVVFGNRLPQTQKKANAFLVSLEKMENYLPTEEGQAPSGMQQNDPRSIRLAVLAHWSFFSTGENAAFVQRVLALNGGGKEPLNVRLLPGAGSGTVVQNALNMGYAPLNHRLRTGGQTVSWYRGPLAPYPIAESRANLPISTADAVTAFDPTTGMFDVSYAAAWMLGRMLALQDKAFSTALYNWKKTAQTATIAAVEKQLIEERLAPLFALAASGPEAVRTQLPNADTLRYKLVQLLLQS
jgi:hypothetical protein